MGAHDQMPADAVAEAQQLHEEDSAPLLAHRRSETLHLEATSTKDDLEGTFWDEVVRFALFIQTIVCFPTSITLRAGHRSGAWWSGQGVLLL